MIEPAFRDIGLDWRYLTLEVKPEGLQGAVEAARVFGFKGFNCTIPHKVEVNPVSGWLGGIGGIDGGRELRS